MRPLPETNITGFRLIDKGAPAVAERIQVFLSAPMRMYRASHYDALARRIEMSLHPRADVLSAREMFLDWSDWCVNYRERIARVSIVYILTDLHGYIGAGQFAELAEMINLPNECDRHPVRKMIAVRPYTRSMHADNLEFCERGHFEMLPNWDFQRCAKFSKSLPSYHISYVELVRKEKKGG